MQTDLAKEAARDGEVMHDRHGMCKFCMQVLNIRTPMIWTDEEADEMATEVCLCKKSRNYTTRKNKIEHLDKALKISFGKGTIRDTAEPVTVEAIRAVAIAVIDGQLGKVTMELPFREDCDSEKLKLSSKGSLFKFEIEKKDKDVTTI